MSKSLFGVELGVHLLSENANTGVKMLFGAAAPGGETYTDAAEQGSIYVRTNGEMYQKNTAGTGTDKWVRMANIDDILALSWRSELVRAATGEALTAGLTDPSGWSDNDDGLTHAAFAQGEYVIGGVGGTPALWEVTAVSAPNITLAAASGPLANNDAFIVRNYLPDAAGQEDQAIVMYNGTSIIKLGDVNWNFADGINLAAGYAAASGDVTASDTVQTALQKIDGNVDALNTLSGVAQGAVNLGTFTGDVISDNTTIKNALQELETYVEGYSSADAVTTAVTLDEINVDDFQMAEWEIMGSLDSAPQNKFFEKITALHDGHAGADAANTDESSHTKLKTGSAVSRTLSIDLNGVGAAQTMRLRAAAGAATSFRARRTALKSGGI